MAVLWVLSDNRCKTMSPGTVWDRAGLLFSSVQIPLRDPIEEAVGYLIHSENSVALRMDRRESSDYS